MKLRQKIRDNQPAILAQGFSFSQPSMKRFATLDGYTTALTQQKKDTLRLNADFLSGVTLDGHILDKGMDSTTGNLRLSNAAFGDLCHFANVPVAFVKSMAKQSESLAMEMLDERIKTHFHGGDDKVFVIDTANNRINGIVPINASQHLDNLDVLDMMTASNEGLEFSRGWMEGPKARMTFKDVTKPFEPAVGDVVHIGTAVTTGINGNQAVHVCDYTERLVCTNGMVAMDKGHSQRISNVGDVKFNVAQAVLTSGKRSMFMIPLMQAATSKFLDVSETRDIREFIAQPQNGGSPTLSDKVAEYALAESRVYGRDEGACTLWDFVNGVTEAAHGTKTINRRSELETMGFKVLNNYLNN
jgi:hypothetical protein